MPVFAVPAAANNGQSSRRTPIGAVDHRLQLAVEAIKSMNAKQTSMDHGIAQVQSNVVELRTIVDRLIPEKQSLMDLEKRITFMAAEAAELNTKTVWITTKLAGLEYAVAEMGRFSDPLRAPEAMSSASGGQFSTPPRRPSPTFSAPEVPSDANPMSPVSELSPIEAAIRLMIQTPDCRKEVVSSMLSNSMLSSP